MNRRFGVELEITGITDEKAEAALRAVGLEVRVEGYTHAASSHWKLVSDSSVFNGFEVVSPILQGEAGLQAASAAINALKTAGARADRTCGFHVHFDASGLGVAELRSILNRYAAFEAQIDAFMPPSRRASVNTYCKTIRPFLDNTRFQQASNVSELAAALAALLRVQPHTLRAAITRIRQAGVAIRTLRRSGTTFYELSDSAAPARPRSVGADALWAGIDAEIATFYRNRAAVLALAA